MRHFKFLTVLALVLILAAPTLADPGDRSREGPTQASWVADFFHSFWQRLTAALSVEGEADTEEPEAPPADKNQPTDPEPSDEECSTDPSYSPWPDPNGCG
jgi:hypothetical protein